MPNGDGTQMRVALQTADTKLQAWFAKSVVVILGARLNLAFVSIAVTDRQRLPVRFHPWILDSKMPQQITVVPPDRMPQV